MIRRPLGRTSLQIFPLVLGGNVFGWTANERSSHAVLDAYVAGGGNFIDTANVYSVWVPGHRGGESETVIGNWLARRGRRDDVLIATKVGWEMGPSQKGLSVAYILKAVEESLRRLRTDYVDVYFSHRDDATLGVEEPLRAYEQLLRSGKVRVIGASNFAAARLREASDVTGLPTYQLLQPHYNLLERDGFEGELQPLCIERGLGVVCYFALASGFLTGKYRSARTSRQRTRPGRQSLSQGPRSCGAACAGRCRRGSWGPPGTGRARLADGPAGGHRPRSPAPPPWPGGATAGRVTAGTTQPRKLAALSAASR